jgi:hypothetical protein
MLAGAEGFVDIARFGKTVRRSSHKRGGKAVIHRVSAFAARQRLVLGQVKVANKIQRDRHASRPAGDRGAIVTTDAMGCQREIARKVIDEKADYILASKAANRSAAGGRCPVRAAAPTPFAGHVGARHATCPSPQRLLSRHGTAPVTALISLPP